MTLQKWYQFGSRKVELSDHRNIWDWIKYNIRAHAIKYSKKKAKERNERGSKLEKEYTEAKQVFETDTNDWNGNNLKMRLRISSNHFMMKKSTE